MFQFFLKKNWWHWSILGSILILFTNWYIVQLDVKINEWFGSFYDIIQKALSEPGTITLGEYYGQLLTFGKIAGLYIFIAVILDFYTKHFIFRWRTSMNDYYTEHWDQLRDIEGAAQRIQEDTRIFAGIMEGLGVGFMRSIMILVAFLPILWGLSDSVTALPVVGPVDQGLVFVAILFAMAGTVGLATVGIKLPGLQYNNQVVEARYRKELVLGEDDSSRADPPSVLELFGNVRKNYFKLFFHYMYFDVAKWSYFTIRRSSSLYSIGPNDYCGSFNTWCNATDY